MEWHYIAPGKPIAERLRRELIGRFSDECLIDTLFSTLPEARSDHLMEGGLQPPQATLGPRQHAAGRARNEIHAGKQAA
ncbi:transposase [Mesorhizobium sp. LSJC269B00]|uniref:transposase n=1 Tax=Mesorhizobium sp. LSJC269B00 TaxID=1287326 RepID=UPI001FD8E3A8|nr:transposase [Mesorhizobium sp. LSJC269B00]